LINNRQGGRRRGRGGQRGQNLGGQPGNRQDNRQRGNAAQLLEKYKSLARDAQLAGDRVQTEYYLQYADHYFRILSENRARFEDQRPRQRGDVAGAPDVLHLRGDEGGGHVVVGPVRGGELAADRVVAVEVEVGGDAEAVGRRLHGRRLRLVEAGAAPDLARGPRRAAIAERKTPLVGDEGDVLVATLVGDPSKAGDAVVLRIKFPPNFQMPPHTHPYSEVVTIISGAIGTSGGEKFEKKGELLKPGALWVYPAKHAHYAWTASEESVLQVQFTGPGGIDYINPADDPRKK